MSQEVSVDTSLLRNCAGKLDDLASRSDGVQDMAKDSNVDNYLWGALGWATVMLPLTYLNLRNSVNEHLGMMGDGFRSSAEKLRAVADCYDDIEAGNATDLSAIGDIIC